MIWRPVDKAGRMARPDKLESGNVRRMLVLDTSYTLEAIRSKKLEASVTCRDLGGYFDHVWTVHPFATLLTSPSWSPKFGKPCERNLSPRHTFIEGKIGRFAFLEKLPFLNFLIAQAALLWRLTALCRAAHVSVIRAGDPLLMGFIGLVLARMVRVPLVVRINSNHERLRQSTGRPMMPRFFRSSRVERVVERFVLSRTDLIAAPSEENRQYAISMGARPERTVIFPRGNLIAPIHFLAPAERGDASAILKDMGVASRPFILCIARLDPSKMPDHAIRAFARIHPSHEEAALIMVGDGAMLPLLRDLAEELGIAGKVIFAGDRDQEWLGRIIPRASAVMSPLTGRALTEVALGAAPTVAYDLDGQGELIRSGETGTLVEAGDITALAQAVHFFMENPDTARRYGLALRHLALAEMDVEALNAHERSQYERLFTGRL